jgi:drug/metabolite transporter (DMT)-like permease
LSAHLGELAALATAVLFSFSSSFLTMAGQRIGSMALNRLRLILAVIWLVLAHAVLRLPLPLQASYEHWFWLGLSGIAGLVLGDLLLFQAFIWIGPRLSMLLLALSPVIAGLIAWLFLGEALLPRQLMGMLLTMAGIGWVILERNGQAHTTTPPGTQNLPAQQTFSLQSPLHPRLPQKYLMGLLCGLGAAVGQAAGLALAKPGVAGGFPALSATLIRMLVAAVTMWLYTLLRRQATQTVRSIVDQPPALWFTLTGSFFGPFLGVTFSIVAIQHTAVGVASTLTSLTPIFLLPIGYFVFKERFSWQAVLGTLLAMFGVALLFLG